MNRIILVRHGETDANTMGCFLGDLDADLSTDPNKLAAIKNMALALEKWENPIKVIICSPAKRAQQTAKIINDILNIDIVIEPNIREISFGSWEGKTSQEVGADELTKWKMRNPDPNTGPTNGETLKSIGDRVENVLNKLCQDYENCTIILVTHVYVIKAALDRAMNLSDGYHSNRLWLDTATATIIDWNLNPEKRIVHRTNWSPCVEYSMNKWTKMNN